MDGNVKTNSLVPVRGLSNRSTPVGAGRKFRARELSGKGSNTLGRPFHGLGISVSSSTECWKQGPSASYRFNPHRSEEHTSELQSQSNLVCRLLLEKKKHH